MLYKGGFSTGLTVYILLEWNYYLNRKYQRHPFYRSFLLASCEAVMWPVSANILFIQSLQDCIIYLHVCVLMRASISNQPKDIATIPFIFSENTMKLLILLTTLIALAASHKCKFNLFRVFVNLIFWCHADN